MYKNILLLSFLIMLTIMSGFFVMKFVFASCENSCRKIHILKNNDTTNYNECTNKCQWIFLREDPLDHYFYDKK